MYKRSIKNFASFLKARSESTDVRMRTAISWDPCGSGDEIEIALYRFSGFPFPNVLEQVGNAHELKRS